MEVVATTGAMRHAKIPVKSSPPTNQYPTFYRSDALRVAQPIVSNVALVRVIIGTQNPHLFLKLKRHTTAVFTAGYQQINHYRSNPRVSCKIVCLTDDGSFQFPSVVLRYHSV